MTMLFRPALLAALLLSGCGPFVDDPSNPPLRGRWQRETKLTAFVVNDVWVDRDKMPLALPEDDSEIKSCMEPALKSSEDINREMAKNTKIQCSFGEIKRDGNTLASTGTCAPSEKFGGTVSGTLEFNGYLKSDDADGKISATIFYKYPSGKTERVRFGVETRWKRLGDCG
jgi:hypothetical protein